MGKYTNPVDITSGRRLHVAQPMDDRVIFQNLADIDQDIILGRTTAWYNGLTALVHDNHKLYVWRLSDNPANAGHPDEPNPNAAVPYNLALMPSDYQYSPGFPNAGYAGYYFNWYPFPEAALLTFEDPVTATNLEGFPEGSYPPAVTNPQEMWDILLYPAQPLTITLSGNPAPGYREKGVVLENITLTADVTKGTEDIDEVEWFRDGGSINVESNPDPNGGDEIFIETNDVGNGVNPPDVSFYATAFDLKPFEAGSNTIWYRFVYPFYVGNLTSTSPTEAQVKSLNKLIVPKQTIEYEHNFSQSRYVIAYPQSYGSLQSILDTNGYETLDDYTIVSDTYTMLDGNSVAYYIYVFQIPGYPSALTDAVNFVNQYKFVK